MFDVKRHPLNYYEESVVAIEEREPLTEGKIIFYGSSGFTRWSERWCGPRGTMPVEKRILGKNGEQVIINHAFGGSTLEEQLYYYPRLIRAYKPKALVFTGFANDFSFGYNTMEIMMLFSRLMEYARTDFPGIKIFITDKRPNAKYVPADPHVEYEERKWDKGAWMNVPNEVNNALREYCRLHDDTTLVEYSKFPWLFEEGCVGNRRKVREELFVEDKVHFTPEAYELLAKEWEKVLADLL